MTDAISRKEAIDALQTYSDETARLDDPREAAMEPHFWAGLETAIEIIESLPLVVADHPTCLGDGCENCSHVLAIVNAQAEDELLWFVAETMPEAYLQQELRRLHAAIEAAALNNSKDLIVEVVADPEPTDEGEKSAAPVEGTE